MIKKILQVLITCVIVYNSIILIVTSFRYFEDFEKRIPRDEIKQVEEIISSELTKLDKDFQITICGSYR